ncbi:MAG: hypothetical protein ACPGTO_06835 [Polaribacter sp.]
MKKSIKTIVSELDKQLSKIQKLVNTIEKKDLQGIDNLRDWLYETEEVFKKLNLPQVSKFSVKRVELVSFLPKDKKNKRKELFNFSANILALSQENLWEVYQNHTEKLDHARKLINQLLNLIYQAKAFKFDATQNFTTFIENIWSFCNSHEQLKSITIQIASFINKSDVLLIIAEEIELEELQ